MIWRVKPARDHARNPGLNHLPQGLGDLSRALIFGFARGPNHGRECHDDKPRIRRRIEIGRHQIITPALPADISGKGRARENARQNSLAPVIPPAFQKIGIPQSRHRAHIRSPGNALADKPAVIRPPRIHHLTGQQSFCLFVQLVQQ